MRSILEYLAKNIDSHIITEHLFTKRSWSHGGRYDYPRMVINTILRGEELYLGDKKQGIDDMQFLVSSDFDHNKLKEILNNIDAKSDEEMVNDFNKTYNGPFKKNIWLSIYKGSFSGQNRKINGGLAFEEELTNNLQSLILGNELSKENIRYDVSMKFWERIQSHPTIKKLKKMNLNSETIQKYVFVSGTGSTARNALGQILNNNSFEINKSKKIKSSTEDEILNVLTQSGKIIADVTITLDGDKFNKSDIDHINKEDIYISCKDGDSQFSGISIQQPFYGNSPKTQNKSYMIDCFKQNKSYEEFISDDKEICVIAYHNLCNLLGVDEKEIYDYFSDKKSDRKTKSIKTNKEPDKNDELFAILIQLLIGGNYWYVNTSGDVIYIDDDITSNKFTFIPSGSGHLDPVQIVVSGKMKTPDGETKCELKFRNSASGDYPFRLMIVPKDKHLLSKLFI